MNSDERRIIDDLFDKLVEAERQAGPREAEAEAHIRMRMNAQPGAPYLMAQTIVVQMQALEAARARIASLEDELARRPAGGGFLAGLFGAGTTAPHAPAAPSRSDRGTGFGSRGTGPAPNPIRQGPAGRGFLAGAAQTAMGVAGGLLLGGLVGGLMGQGEAHASPEASPDGSTDPARAAGPSDAEPTGADQADTADDAAADAWDDDT